MSKQFIRSVRRIIDKLDLSYTAKPEGNSEEQEKDDNTKHTEALAAEPVTNLRPTVPNVIVCMCGADMCMCVWMQNKSQRRNDFLEERVFLLHLIQTLFSFQDFEVFLNLVDLSRDLLLKINTQFFLPWVRRRSGVKGNMREYELGETVFGMIILLPKRVDANFVVLHCVINLDIVLRASTKKKVSTFGRDMISKSNRLPLVSGFYKLLNILMQLCERHQYFKGVEAAREVSVCSAFFMVLSSLLQNPFHFYMPEANDSIVMLCYGGRMRVNLTLFRQ